MVAVFCYKTFFEEPFDMFRHYATFTEIEKRFRLFGFPVNDSAFHDVLDGAGFSQKAE